MSCTAISASRTSQHGLWRIASAKLWPVIIALLAVLTAFIVGSIFILITDFENLSKLGTDPIGAIGGAFGLIIQAYQSMIVGAFGDPARIMAANLDSWFKPRESKGTCNGHSINVLSFFVDRSYELKLLNPFSLPR